MNLLYCIVRMPKAVSSKRHYARGGVPYRIYGGLSFYQRKEIKDVIAYFRLAVNPNDEEAFKRVINYPARGIGNTTLNKIIDAANVHRVSLWKVLNEPLTYGVSLTKGTHTKLQAFRDLIAGFVEAVSHTEPTSWEKTLSVSRVSSMIFIRTVRLRI